MTETTDSTNYEYIELKNDINDDGDDQENEYINNISNDRKINIKGVLIMIFGAICYSILVSIIKWASNLGYQSMQILIFKSMIQISIAIPISLMKFENKNKNNAFFMSSIKCDFKNLLTKTKQIGKKLWIFIIFRGIFGALTSIFYFEAITKLPIGDAMAIYSMYPVPTSFVAICILNENISYKYFISLLLCIIGTFLIIHPVFIFGDNTEENKSIIIGYITAIISAILMSGVFIFIRLAKKAPPTILIISQGISCIIEGVILLFIFQHFYLLYTIYDYICLLSIGCIGYLAQWSLTKSSQILPAALSSILRSTEILWTYLSQIIFFNQLPSYLTIIGVIAILIAILTVTLEKIRQKKERDKQETQSISLSTQKTNN